MSRHKAKLLGLKDGSPPTSYTTLPAGRAARLEHPIFSINQPIFFHHAERVR